MVNYVDIVIRSIAIASCRQILLVIASCKVYLQECLQLIIIHQTHVTTVFGTVSNETALVKQDFIWGRAGSDVPLPPQDEVVGCQHHNKQARIQVRPPRKVAPFQLSGAHYNLLVGVSSVARRDFRIDTAGPTVSKVAPSYLRTLITLTCQKYYCNDLVGH